MESFVKKINLLIIGNNDWCVTLANRLLAEQHQNYNIQYIYTYRQAIKRLRHNSYDILLLQEDYFNYNSIELSKLSYAMSRPSIILCNSLFKILIYQIWKRTSEWTNKFSISKKLIHFKLLNTKKLSDYINQVQHQHDYIKQISNQIQRKVKIIK